MRKLVGVVLALIVIVVFAPWVSGFWFERTYRDLISYYNAQGDIRIQVLNYHRGWLHSDAIIQVKIINPAVYSFWQEELEIENPKLDITINQHIEHGPILVNNAKLPSIFGLAVIHNTMHVAPDIQKAFAVAQVDQSVLESDDLVTFAGNYFKHIELKALQFEFPDSDVLLQLKKGLSAGIWVLPKQKKIMGEIHFFDFVLSEEDDSITLPEAHIQFDQSQSLSGLWLGKIAFQFPELRGVDSFQHILTISDFNFDGGVFESSGKIYGSRKLRIKKITFDDQSIGPVHLQMSVSGLNAKAIGNLITTYRKITSEGELYASQLQQKMSAMLPSVFSQKSKIQLNKLDFMAPEGTLKASGEMNWPNNEASASGLMSLLEDSNAEANIRISKPLVEKIINLIGQSPYSRSISPERRKELMGMQSDLQMASQRNFLFISMLVNNGLLSSDQALVLLDMQRNDASLENYYLFVKKLFLAKEIFRPYTYMLVWQYGDVKHKSLAFDQELDLDQTVTQKQLHSQWNTWVKQGYITQDQNDYVVSIKKENEVTKLNGKEI